MFRQLCRVTAKVSKASTISSRPAVLIQPVRYMADKPTLVSRKLIPVDPSEIDRCVTLVLNPVTKEYEAVVVAAVEPSFEWVHSSPVDLHTFDVTPVVKDCIDPTKEFDAEDY